MVTSTYMPDVKVEIAFNSGFSTPTGSRTWTDVSQWVELDQGISIGYGRQDERSQADANTLSLTLDNSDGRFTPARVSSPYFPNVKLYRPIRVTATPPGGSPSVRFTGFVNQWPVEWNGSSSYAKATLTAASRLAILGLLDVRQSIIEEAILERRPTAYFTLGDPEESVVASESSGNGGQPAVAAGSGNAVVFGAATGPGTDGLTAATFNNGRFLLAPLTWQGSPTAAITLSAFINTNDSTGTILTFRTDQDAAVGFTGATGGGALVDGATHHLAIVRDFASSQQTIYIDGVVSSTTPFLGTQFHGAKSATLAMGGGRDASGLIGVLAHVAMFSTALTAVDVAEIAEAGLTGYANESSSARFTRYAEWAGVSAETTFSGNDLTNVVVDTSGASLIDLMRQIEVTESAVLHDTRGGILAMTGEYVRYNAAAAFTLDMGKQQVEADFAPQLDPSTIVNDVTAARSDGTASARVVDESSRTEYGRAFGSVETTATSSEIPLQLAAWTVNRYAEPQPRVPNLTVDITAQAGTTPTPTALLAADIGTRVTVVNQPSQAAATTADYFIEGYTETFGAESHVISFNVSPGAPYLQVLILDHPTRGLPNGSNVLGL